MNMVLIGESKVDDKARVVLPRELRGYEKILFYEVTINGERYIIVKGEE